MKLNIIQNRSHLQARHNWSQQLIEQDQLRFSLSLSNQVPAEIFTPEQTNLYRNKILNSDLMPHFFPQSKAQNRHFLSSVWCENLWVKFQAREFNLRYQIHLNNQSQRKRHQVCLSWLDMKSSLEVIELQASIKICLWVQFRKQSWQNEINLSAKRKQYWQMRGWLQHLWWLSFQIEKNYWVLNTRTIFQ